MKAYLAALIGFALLCTAPAHAEDAPAAPSFYTYAHTDAEYTVMLPEAPVSKTIWADDPEIPYLENLPQNGEEIGETATFRRVDPATGQFFDSTIIFLKADAEFLKNLKQDKIQATIEEDLKDIKMEGIKKDFAGTPENPLKWATLTGFATGRSNHPVFHAEHYLTGVQSIMVIRISYSLENATFNEYYKKLTDSIKYRPL